MSSRALPPKKDIERMKRHNGAVNTIQIRVVCRQHCNSGWMSALEESAKPILIPLMLGQPAILAAKQQRILAAWYALKVMVAEFSAPEDMVSLQLDRTSLMRTHEPPENWQIWVGHHRGSDWWVRYIRNSTTLALATDDGQLLSPLGPLSKNVQAVTMGIGELLLHAVSTPPGIDIELDYNLARPLQRVWPVSNGILWPPGQILSDRDCETVARSLQRFVEGLHWQPSPQ